MEEEPRLFDLSPPGGEREQRIRAVGHDIIDGVVKALLEHKDAKRITDDEVPDVIRHILDDLSRAIGKTLPPAGAEPSKPDRQQIELAAGVYVDIPKE